MDEDDQMFDDALEQLEMNFNQSENDTENEEGEENEEDPGF